MIARPVYHRSGPARLGLLAVLLFVAVTAPAESRATAEGRPNILFIYTDDQSHRTVSAYPEAFDWVNTPAIDELAAEGIRFANAYMGTWCMPARASILTGLHQFGVESMRMVGQYPGSTYDPEILKFWPEVFRKSGYFTAQIGKWHTGVDTGFGRDWDFQIVWNRPAHPRTSQNYYYDQPITFHGGETKMMAEYSTDLYTTWAVDFVNGEGRDESKPWFLWLNYSAVHQPFTPAARHVDDYPDIEVSPPDDIYGPREGKPNWANEINRWEANSQGEPMSKFRSLTSWVQSYHQGVLALDEGVDRVVTALEESGQRDNTLIIFASDQGLAWGQHGFDGHKFAAYDANIRAPLIISMPVRFAKGSVIDVPVTGVDIAPTIFRIAGIDLPWAMHGNDLTPLLLDPDRRWPHPALVASTGYKFGSDTNVIPSMKEDFFNLVTGVPWYVMLREGRFKYIRPLTVDFEELYDLEADPEELDNLAMRPEFRDRLSKMRAAAIIELRKHGAGFVDAMPPVLMTVQ